MFPPEYIWSGTIFGSSSQSWNTVFGFALRLHTSSPRSFFGFLIGVAHIVTKMLLNGTKMMMSSESFHSRNPFGFALLHSLLKEVVKHPNHFPVLTRFFFLLIYHWLNYLLNYFLLYYVFNILEGLLYWEGRALDSRVLCSFLFVVFPLKPDKYDYHHWKNDSKTERDGYLILESVFHYWILNFTSYFLW